MSDTTPHMKAVPEIFADENALASALAERVAALAAEAVAARGRFALAIPGGSVLSLLARGWPPRTAAADWHVFWTDERGVPLADPRSNFHLAETELLPKLPGARVHPVRGSAADYETEIAPFLPLDLALLGLGEDGHVASLFPGNPALLETSRAVADVHGAPKPPPDRVTLTLPALNRARQLLVVASGSAKAAIVARIFSAPSGLPARLLRPANGDLRWLLDRAAAAHLEDLP